MNHPQNPLNQIHADAMELQTLESLITVDNQLNAAQFKQVTLHERGTGLEFEDISYTVMKKQKKEGNWVSRQVDLLHNITGYAPKGHITAVMGPSGAGKSTFLDALAGRIASGSLKGMLTLDSTSVSPTLMKRVSAYVMQDDQLFPMLTVWETLRFAAEMRLPQSFPKHLKDERVESLITQLGLTSSRNTYIGDEGHRGVSGGERRRVSIGVDIVHGPSLLFLDEPTSGLDSTSAYSVIEKVYDIAKKGSTIVLTIHQPSYRIQCLLNHLIILARGKLIYHGSPHGLNSHIHGLGKQLPSGENPIEYMLDTIQEFDGSTTGIEPLVHYNLTGIKPEVLNSSGGLTPRMSYVRTASGKKGTWKAMRSPFNIISSGNSTPVKDPEAMNAPMTPAHSTEFEIVDDDNNEDRDFDHSLQRSSFTAAAAAANIPSPWLAVGSAASFYKGFLEVAFTPRRHSTSNSISNIRTPRIKHHRNSTAMAGLDDAATSFESTGYIVAKTPQAVPNYTAGQAVELSTPVSNSDRCYTEADYNTDGCGTAPPSSRSTQSLLLDPKYGNSWTRETGILMVRNFRIIRRTPELFLSRQIVLTAMGFMMATMFTNPGDDLQGVTKLTSFFVFTVCLFFFSSNDAVPTFIQERFIFIRETSHNSYRSSSYVVAGILTYLPFLAIQSLTYSLLTWWALSLKGNLSGFSFFWLVLFASLIATNSLVVFISALVPNYILGYSAVIAFTALFFLTCGYFVRRTQIPKFWTWLHYTSIIKYSYEALLHNQFEVDACYNSIKGTCYLSNTQILSALAINKPSTKWGCFWILIMWAAFYRFLFYIVLRFASKNQRK